MKVASSSGWIDSACVASSDLVPPAQRPAGAGEVGQGVAEELGVPGAGRRVERLLADLDGSAQVVRAQQPQQVGQADALLEQVLGPAGGCHRQVDHRRREPEAATLVGQDGEGDEGANHARLVAEPFGDPELLHGQVEAASAEAAQHEDVGIEHLGVDPGVGALVAQSLVPRLDQVERALVVRRTTRQRAAQRRGRQRLAVTVAERREGGRRLAGQRHLLVEEAAGLVAGLGLGELQVGAGRQGRWPGRALGRGGRRPRWGSPARWPWWRPAGAGRSRGRSARARRGRRARPRRRRRSAGRAPVRARRSELRPRPSATSRWVCLRSRRDRVP